MVRRPQQHRRTRRHQHMQNMPQPNTMHRRSHQHDQHRLPHLRHLGRTTSERPRIPITRTARQSQTQKRHLTHTHHQAAAHRPTPKAAQPPPPTPTKPHATTTTNTNKDQKQPRPPPTAYESIPFTNSRCSSKDIHTNHHIGKGSELPQKHSHNQRTHPPTSSTRTQQGAYPGVTHTQASHHKNFNTEPARSIRTNRSPTHASHDHRRNELRFFYVPPARKPRTFFSLRKPWHLIHMGGSVGIQADRWRFGRISRDSGGFHFGGAGEAG